MVIMLHTKRLNPAAELPSKPQKELFFTCLSAVYMMITLHHKRTIKLSK